MRELSVSEITNAVKTMCIKANCCLNSDIFDALKSGLANETNPTAQNMLENIIKNAEIARDEQIPICQDTGMAIVFIRLGQDVHLTGGSLKDAVNAGVRQGYQEGYLRKSVVADPVRRGNTNDNTPAILYTEIIDGESVEITIAPKGFGSENMSAVKMLKPSDGLDGIIRFVTQTVKNAGSNPCPPLVIGVGIGGSFEKAAYMAKHALTRDITRSHPDPYYAELEDTLLKEINKLDIGPQGFGGKTTALGVNVETFPTHIAGMPCAVNISCHVTRHLKVTL